MPNYPRIRNYTDEEIEEIKNVVVQGIEQGLRMDQIDVGSDYYINEQAAIIYLTLKNPNMHWIFGAKEPPPGKNDGALEVDTSQLPDSIPQLVDMRPLCSPVENQGNIASCTANAVVGAIELLENRAHSFMDKSRLFIYWNSRNLEGTINKDDGAYVSDAVKVPSLIGVCSEATWPYNTNLVFTKPSDPAYGEAVNFKVKQSLKVSDKNVLAARKVLAQGYPIVFAMDCFSQFLSTNAMRTGILQMPVQGEKSQGGHSVLLVGYDDAKQCFIVRNSWGFLWGLQGFFYMPYEYYEYFTWDSWSITTI